MVQTEELLKYAIDNGIIDLNSISQCVEDEMKDKYLTMHKGRVWQGENGSWYTYVSLEAGDRKLLRKSTREALNEAIIDYYRACQYTFEQMFNKWIEFKITHKEVEKQSIDRYKATYKRYLEEFGKNIFCEITPKELERYIRDTIAENEMTAKMWSDLRTVILGVFSYGKYDSAFSISQFMGDLRLAPKTFRQKRKRDEDDVFTQAELKLIEQDLMSNPDMVGMAILLAMRTGMRAGEVVALKWSDIQGDIINVCRTEIRFKEEYRIRNAKKERYAYDVRDFTKGAKGYRQIVLTQQDVEFIKRIRSMNPFGEYVFIKNKKRILSRGLDPKLYRCCMRCNIPKRSMHKLRKAYATSLINANVPASIIKEQMGHTDLQTTMQYYYRENHSHSEIKENIEKARANVV